MISHLNLEGNFKKIYMCKVGHPKEAVNEPVE